MGDVELWHKVLKGRKDNVGDTLAHSSVNSSSVLLDLVLKGLLGVVALVKLPDWRVSVSSLQA